MATVNEPFVSFDEMCWVYPCQRTEEIGYALRYAGDHLTKQDRLVAASIIDDYAELIRCPEAKRRAVVRALRACGHGGA